MSSDRSPGRERRAKASPRVPGAVARLIAPAYRDAMLGDLSEDHQRRLQRRGGLRGRVVAGLCFWAEVALAVVTSRWNERRNGSHRPAEVALDEDHPPFAPQAHAGGFALETLAQDLRHAARAALREGVTTLLVIATMAVGIGATTAIYSVVAAVLLRPLPYESPARLVEVLPERPLSRAQFTRLREGAGAYEGMSAHVSGFEVRLGTEGEPEQLVTAMVSPAHFELLGIEPELGRTFRAEEARPGAEAVAILGHGLWQRQFGGDPEVIGRVVRMNGLGAETRRIVGILPRGYRPMQKGVELWVPLVIDPSAGDYQNVYLSVLGRLRPDKPAGAAAAELSTLLPTVFPDLDGEALARLRRLATVESLRDTIVGDVETALWVQLAAVGFVVLMIFVNVANLLLARSSSRRREMATRAALGASRARLMRQVLAEAVSLSLVAGAVGVWLAFVSLPALVARLPETVPRTEEISVDLGVLGFALLVTLSGGLTFGAVPAFRLPTGRLQEAIGDQGRSGIGRRHKRAYTTLVAAQTAFAIVLSAGAGVAARSVWELLSTDPGFEDDGVLVVSLSPPSDRAPGRESFRAWVDALSSRLESLPGVESTGWIQRIPMTPYRWSNPYYPEGTVVGEGEEPPLASFRVVSEGYFETLRIPLLRGRLFESTDRDGAPRVVLVNEALARSAWPGEGAVGKSLRMSPDDDPLTVVGVVGDVRQHRLEEAPLPEFYLTMRQTGIRPHNVMIRTSGDAAGHAGEVRALIASESSGAPITRLAPLSRLTRATASDSIFLAGLLGGFGLLAVILGASGVYGVTAYAVARRTPEHGLRLALGAAPGRLVRDSVLRSLRPVLVGLAAGAAMALLASEALSSLVYRVEPDDPLVLGSVCAFLLLVSALAAYLPARRVSRVDPVDSLRVG